MFYLELKAFNPNSVNLVFWQHSLPKEVKEKIWENL